MHQGETSSVARGVSTCMHTDTNTQDDVAKRLRLCIASTRNQPENVAVWHCFFMQVAITDTNIFYDICIVYSLPCVSIAILLFYIEGLYIYSCTRMEFAQNASCLGGVQLLMASTDALNSDSLFPLGMKQYGSMSYCVLHLSVLQYIVILQYLIGFDKKAFHMGVSVLAVKKRIQLHSVAITV